MKVGESMPLKYLESSRYSVTWHVNASFLFLHPRPSMMHLPIESYYKLSSKVAVVCRIGRDNERG